VAQHGPTELDYLRTSSIAVAAGAAMTLPNRLKRIVQGDKHYVIGGPMNR
jgi:hypothetical protein